MKTSRENIINSIFTSERRRSFSEAFATFFEDLQSIVNTTTGNTLKIFAYLNYCIRYWPHRCGATSIEDYLKGIEIDITKLKEDKEQLLVLELLINLLYWAPRQDSNDDLNTELTIQFKKNDVQNESERMIDNAKFMLEQCCNMTIREEADKVFPKYFITKRNAKVDIAVAIVPALKDILLAYTDFRNMNDLEFKKNALTAIYRYLEPSRTTHKTLSCSAISEEFFASMNTFGIRHNTKSQVSMQGKKKIAVCDKLFMMAIFVLQTSEVTTLKDELKEWRENGRI